MSIETLSLYRTFILIRFDTDLKQAPFGSVLAATGLLGQTVWT